MKCFVHITIFESKKMHFTNQAGMYICFVKEGWIIIFDLTVIVHYSMHKLVLIQEI